MWTVQGSGWGWLGYSKQLDKVVMTTSPNQDPVHLQVLPQKPPNKRLSVILICRGAHMLPAWHFVALSMLCPCTGAGAIAGH